LEETVGPLMEHDRAHGTELVKTLESYFECNGNVKKMASRLYTHYNTVIYRLRRIEGITGLDLRDPEARLNLQMGLKIARLRNYTKLT
jgi:purine catabolism regulator